MQMLKRNQQTIKYKNWVSESAIVDDEGNETGEKQQTYSSIVVQKAYVTPSQGIVDEKMFGEDVKYDKVILVDKTTINEQSILWVDDLNETHEHDYQVKKIAKSLNSYAIAIKKV